MFIVLDTSTLLNFLCIDRTDLIGAHPFTFVTVQEVADEVSYPESRVRYENALSAGHIEQWDLSEPAENEMYTGFREADIGKGESAVIAVALNRGCGLSLDDEEAIEHAKAKAHELGKSPVILRTRDIVVDLIRCGKISIEQADSLLADWATNHQFNLKISSFSECMTDDRKR